MTEGVGEFTLSAVAQTTGVSIDTSAPLPTISANQSPTFTVEVGSLERLIEDAQAKLQQIRTEGYVQDARRAAQREIDAAQSALNIADQTIGKFERLIVEALADLDEAIDKQFSAPSIGAFGVPLLENEAVRVRQAAARFVGFKQTLAQHRRARERQAVRLEDLLRVRASA